MDDEKRDNQDGDSSRPSLYGAIGLTLTAAFIWATGVSRTTRGLMVVFAGLAWAAHLRARARLQHRGIPNSRAG